MGNLLILWLRGMVFTVAFFMAVAVFYGLISFTIAVPTVGLPVLLLIILPFTLGTLTEGKL